jgi:membrane-bound ClpP family serine protease
MLTAITRVTRQAQRARWALPAFLLLAAAASAAGQEETDPGRVLPVAAPVTPDTAGRLREAITEAVKRAEPRRAQRVFKVILDFNPDGRPNGSKDFGPCYELADFLRKLRGQGVRTVAFVHGEVTRHSVLPVLSCSEVVFSKTAELGDVVRDPGETLDPVKRLAYDEVARNRLPSALVRKMYDRELVVVRTPDGAGDRYRDAREAKAGEPVLLSGTTARYTFAQASGFGLCQPDPRETVADVAAAYHLGRESLENDPQLGRAPVAWLIAVEGPINPELRERLPRRIRRALGARANLIVLVLRCHGGDSESAADLAAYLEGINKDRPDNPVRLVAFVTGEAADTAAFPALACDRIVMHPKARLGGLDQFLRANPGRADVVRKNLEELASRHAYPPALARAMADESLRVYRVQPARGGGATQFITRQELDEDLARPERRWRDERPVKAEDGKCLAVDAESARSYGLADAVEDDVAGVCQLEGLEPSQVHDATRDRDWLDDLANFLRDPWTSVVLVMVGITCLILELKMPGVSLPGVIAAVCFVLFFWSHSQLNGQITWLALLLFVLGLLLIGLEMFVLPGMGVAGISGTVLVLGSLGLVAYGHWPRSNEEWVGFGRTIGPFGISVLGALVSAFVLARFLPSIPFANRLILKPADEATEFDEESPGHATAGPDLSELLGAVGVAATPLRPAGKVQFGDEFVDVVAEGGYVPPGARVQVVEIEGIRVVVKEV